MLSSSRYACSRSGKGSHRIENLCALTGGMAGVADFGPHFLRACEAAAIAAAAAAGWVSAALLSAVVVVIWLLFFLGSRSGRGQQEP